MTCNDFLVWHQLLVDVGNDIFRVVYLDTSQQALLYDPSITAVDLNISTQFRFEERPEDGPFILRNRVLPASGPTYDDTIGNSMFRIVFQVVNERVRPVFQDNSLGNGTFAIYSRVRGDPNTRIYFRPTTPEVPGEPRSNQILGHELPRSEWNDPANYVFRRGVQSSIVDCKFNIQFIKPEGPVGASY